MPGGGEDVSRPNAPFGRLLVANRGEIAVRVIRACRELGISSVAVYSDADRGAMHVRLADEAHPIGPAPAAESYLNVGKLVEVAKRTGAEAVHPGYGFLSESAAFARAVGEAGIAWVGPPPGAMEGVGDKVRAKELAREAGVPTVPGYAGEDESEDKLLEEAERIGFPVLVKASAGAGARDAPGAREEGLRGGRSQREAGGRGRLREGSVFLEKLVEDPRHVEVQVIADRHGGVVHLCERECSIQRRHQKILEEAPSPALDEGLREGMGEAAVSLARAAGYENAGTVEFLLSGEEFYFLEMNARLQVEHPVTELVTGVDLVHLQLLVASGEPLPLRQEDVSPRGVAIEVRLYAEDPYTGLPSGGRLLDFASPQGPGIRNDAGVEAGDEVSLSYDPMISKLIVHGPDRGAAVARLRRALGDLRVLGVTTNLPLLRRIADNPAFAAGETTTGFLEGHGLTEPEEEPTPPREAVLLAAAGELSGAGDGDPFGAGPWRLGGATRLAYGEREVLVSRTGTSSSLWEMVVDGETSVVEVLSPASVGSLRISVDGRPVEGGFARGEGSAWVSLGGVSYRFGGLEPPSAEGDAAGEAGGASLVAPMPGTVVKVMVGEGDEVEEGQPLLVLEAMKMEQTVSAPHAGVVEALPYGEGEMVPGGAVLAEVGERGEG
ncbi:acetyl/propionyl/methylcrotonyl-CoA carboxylase subunit alpha [Rubrobacter marinus]|uniref:acetyl/propionyl/methylcrotonyl-CoA carboxylase subunit alpha n=1 Tax=Rubrobacter marinus TaxID=2653852 RepID=UPI001D188B14|nr:biotin carboxylase N-terminal domain-containing protein [Rubrobacter marinus]